MGLTSFKGNYVTVADTHVAKNYLNEPELKQLNFAGYKRPSDDHEELDR